MSDAETLGLGSRKRKSASRRSSILKGPKSPPRNALGDLDPNSDVEDVQCRQETKKLKRLSRRVSFAETYEVKEYLKDADALSMGIWRQRDGSGETTVPENETNQGQHATAGDSGQNLSRADVQQPPQIQGLESLLSGQIKNPVALYNCPENACGGNTDVSTGGNMAVRTDSQYLPNVSEADQNPGKIDSFMFTKKFISKIDGPMFLKKLVNDGENTSKSTVRGVSNYQQSCISQVQEDVPSDDHTVHFRAAESDMDITRCQDNTATLPYTAFHSITDEHAHTGLQSDVVPTMRYPDSAGTHTVPSDDHTVHFRSAESDMDMTKCQDNIATLPYTAFHPITDEHTHTGSNKVQQYPGSARDQFTTAINQTNQSENRQQDLSQKIFNSKNIMAKFDHFMSVNQTSQIYSNYPLGSSTENGTRHFSAGRELLAQTEPLQTMEADGSVIPEVASDTTLHLDQTMDITLCNSTLGAANFTGSLESTNTIMQALDKELADREMKSSIPGVMEQEQFISNMGNETVELDSDDKTRMFTTEDMTTCIGGVISEKPEGMSKLQSLSRRLRRISNISQDPDRTRMFAFDDDTAAMEITACNSYIPIRSCSDDSIGNAKRPDMSPVGQTERTIVFEDGDGMDMTCVTAPVDMPSMITSNLASCNSNVASSLHPESGQVAVVDACHVDQLNSSLQAAQDGNTSINICYDQTHVFSEDTAAVMESMDHDIVQFKQSTLPGEDKTQLFCSDMTAPMELTKCITFPNLETSEQLPMCDISEMVAPDKGKSVLMTESSLPELIQNDQLKSVKPLNVPLVQKQLSTSITVSGHESVMPNTMELVHTSTQPVNVPPVENKISTSFTVSDHESVMPNPSKTEILTQPMKVPPVENKVSTSFTVSSQETVIANANKPLDVSSKRDSDTFVIDQSKDTFVVDDDATVTESNPQDHNIIEHGENLDDTFTVSAEAPATSDDQKEKTDSQKVCDWPNNMTGEDGIMDEEPMNFEDITDHGETTKASMGLSRSLNSTSVTQDTTSLNKSDIRALSIFDGDCTDQMHLPEGNISVAEFCQYFHIQFRKESRRSTLAPISIQPLESIADYLELLCIIQPQYFKYEWAVDYLTKQTEKMLELANAGEKEITENNPPLFNEIRKATPDKLNEFRSCLKSLHHACNKSAKLNWSKWKAKLNTGLLEELKDEHSWLTEQNDKLHGDNNKLVTSLETLNKVECDLDAAIAELELHELPTEDDLEKLKMSEELESEMKLKNAQLEALQEKHAILDKKRNEVFAEKEGLQETENKLREEAAESGDSDSAKEEVKAAFNKVNQWQSFFEWELEEWNQYEALYTFLHSSISMELTFGKTLDNTLAYGKPEREIVNIKLESLLADDASPCAQLAHKMVLGALDHVSLQQKCPTTRWLPMLLTHVSFVMCKTRQLVRELDHLMFRYEVEIKGTCVAVEFSNIANLAKFVVQFHLVPGSYPNSKIVHSFTNMIGNISYDVITSSLSAVKPGFKYLCRLVDGIEQMLCHSATK